MERIRKIFFFMSIICFTKLKSCFILLLIRYLDPEVVNFIYDGKKGVNMVSFYH